LTEAEDSLGGTNDIVGALGLMQQVKQTNKK